MTGYANDRHIRPNAAGGDAITLAGTIQACHAPARGLPARCRRLAQ